MANNLKIVSLNTIPFPKRRDTLINPLGYLNINTGVFMLGRLFKTRVYPRFCDLGAFFFIFFSGGVPLAKIAARVMVGETLQQQGYVNQRIPPYYSVKESVFPFIKFAGADPILGPEMKSTGEVMGIGRSFGEAYAKAQLASGVVLPQKGAALISVRDRDKDGAVELAKILVERGFDIVATHGTAEKLAAAGVFCRRANKVREGRPHIVDMIKNDEFSLIVNTTEGKQAIQESLPIRAEAVRRYVTYYTTLGAAVATCTALEHIGNIEVNRLQDLHKEVAA